MTWKNCPFPPRFSWALFNTALWLHTCSNCNSNDADDRFSQSFKVEKCLGISLDCFDEVLSVDTCIYTRKRESILMYRLRLILYVFYMDNKCGLYFCSEARTSNWRSPHYAERKRRESAPGLLKGKRYGV